MAGAYPSCHWAGAGGVHCRKVVPQGSWGTTFATFEAGTKRTCKLHKEKPQAVSNSNFIISVK